MFTNNYLLLTCKTQFHAKHNLPSGVTVAGLGGRGTLVVVSAVPIMNGERKESNFILVQHSCSNHTLNHVIFLFETPFIYIFHSIAKYNFNIFLCRILLIGQSFTKANCSLVIFIISTTLHTAINKMQLILSTIDPYLPAKQYFVDTCGVRLAILQDLPPFCPYTSLLDLCYLSGR